ncbi:hypothetical protein CC1G_09071 [Coprinopsis cinerea okayama7|uniref:Uncharacterized protein n=1 Tax=Coprinopsis cinerea (strain Okayama-7 / 130 / ATCC MYA-4618 / FGSC 9003) TaxID=240176 RepID=A8P310_COPC7|nr:hypothetical protein CC1G_09071 [Coprinopsis cinerea okayama7\|eukprot:XP_001838443.1 hypothetical protein CC1G_09071 [Coprinopsis cinerea okayama7\
MEERFPPAITKDFMARYGHLPKELLPWRMNPKDPQTAKEWRIALTKLLPSPNIPHGLRLRPGHQFQPPRFNFGWAVDDLTIRDIAYRCGFPRFFNDSSQSPNSESTPVLYWQAASKLLQGVLSEKFPDVLKEVPGPIRIEKVIGPKGDDRTMCIVLADSLRTGNRKPKQEHIDTLREFFGIGTKEEGKYEPYGGPEPMWWLDSFYRTWKWCYSWEYEAENDLRDWRTLMPGGRHRR